MYIHFFLNDWPLAIFTRKTKKNKDMVTTLAKQSCVIVIAWNKYPLSVNGDHIPFSYVIFNLPSGR